MLISDYSSAYFDYSLLHKPMFNYSYDYQEYLKKRNFYLPITELPCKIHYDEDSLLDDIKHFSYVEACQKSTEFQSKYAKNGGNASLTIINYIKNLKAKG
jgi:CDP-glycerol glycerophosphotransferase